MELFVISIIELAVGIAIGLIIAAILRRQPQPPVTITFAGLKGTQIMDYIVKDDQPDVAYSVTLGEVKDAEGEVITDPAGLTVQVVSSSDAAVSVIPNADPKTGTVHFGAPGQATVTVNVKDASDNILATGAANFTVTTGDPKTISSVDVAFEGLTPQP